MDKYKVICPLIIRHQLTLKNSRARAVHQVDSSAEIKEMKAMLQKLMSAQGAQPVAPKVCEFCTSTKHKTDACPTLFEESGDVNALGGWDNRGPERQNQPRFGLAANGFRWRKDSNPQRQPAEYRTPQQAQQAYNPLHRCNDAPAKNNQQPRCSLEQPDAQPAAPATNQQGVAPGMIDRAYLYALFRS